MEQGEIVDVVDVDAALQEAVTEPHVRIATEVELEACVALQQPAGPTGKAIEIERELKAFTENVGRLEVEQRHEADVVIIGSLPALLENYISVPDQRRRADGEFPFGRIAESVAVG